MLKSENELLNKYYELGDTISKFASYQPIIQINIDTALEVANNIEDEDKKLRFFGGRYLDLVEQLKKAGIIN